MGKLDAGVLVDVIGVEARIVGCAELLGSM